MQNQIRGQELKKVRVGQAVVSVCGPGDFPKFGMGNRNGVVIGCTEDRWGVHLDIKWDDGHNGSTEMLKDPSRNGIGVYAYPSLEVAIQ